MQVDSQSIPNLSEFLNDETKYMQHLENAVNWRSIPLVNYTPSHELKDSSMVRFRGMIQDMLDPEIYLEQYQVISTTGASSSRAQSGKYRDCLVLHSGESVSLESPENVQGERRTIFVVSLPGINHWASAFEESNCSKPYCTALNHNSQTQTVAKRSALDEGDEEMRGIDIKAKSRKENKRQCLEIRSQTFPDGSSSSLSMEYLLNSPIPERPSKACLVKLYSNFDSYTLNSIVDVVGFLSVDPSLDGSTFTDLCDVFENFNELKAQNPPPSLIPRLHAVAVKKLAHNNPLLDPLVCEISEPNMNFETVCKDLKILLTQCLIGDELAAEYLLVHLISTVYIRSDLQCIGKFALNICNLPKEILPNYTQELYEILELFLPASHYLPMTLDTINTIQFFPKKDYETGKLTSGILQLAPHTHLVLDETRLEPGKLDATGVQGVQNLGHFIQSQQIRCNFHYYDIDFDTDIPVLILSEGKSMLPNDFLVPLNADPDSIGLIGETLKATKHYAQPKLNAIRRYLTSAKISNFSMNPDESEMIQMDFVEMRKSNPNIGADELHNFLVLSRLLAIASGRSTLDRQCWDRAKEIEELRRNRIRSMPKLNRNY